MCSYNVFTYFHDLCLIPQLCNVLYHFVVGPECLAASSMPKNANHESLDSDNSFFIFGITLMPILSMDFLHRLLSFGTGCLLYFLMSKYAFPLEPEEILASHLESVQNNQQQSLRRRTSSGGSIKSFLSDKSSDDEYEEEDEIDIDIDNSVSSTGTHSKGTYNKSSPAKDNKSSNNNRATSFNNQVSPQNKKNSLQRRGMGSDGGENDIEFGLITSPAKRKGVFRRPPTERITNPFTTCISSIRSFTRGSDLATSEQRKANRVAMLLFFSLLIHNFPEGLAVAASALESQELGMTVTVGIMIHNIPEGIAIAIPCLAARPDSPWLSFILASVSGLAEPAGAFVSLVFLRGVERRQTGGGNVGEGESIGGEGALENVLAFVAGIMITVSFLELFPEAKRHAQKIGMKAYYIGIVVGFLVMIATEFGMSL